ncbi:unnamed protein product [Microthlaspi erraticum]|uniref:F-box domain-containing protein n=1 Tax=Microthlaspi erraticum TaxID=1685480 RepID=A0A6D2IFQ2_9BRAS|nr:unnamed protein product [Microthlaspi erraticum]
MARTGGRGCYVRYIERKRATRARAEARAREDRISNLPDSLISQILSHLPTKDTVRTSALSKRWKGAWLLIPGLDLASSEFPDYSAFVSVVDRLLGFCREEKLCMHKLKLKIWKRKRDPPCVTRWIEFVVRGKLEHLDVECLKRSKYLEVMPLSLYMCDTLVYLRLSRVSLRELESVSLPRLKTMGLEHNVYANDASLESLISSCPVLEDLNLVRMVTDNVKVVRVYSQTLTSLDIDYDNDYVYGCVRKGSGVLIDAPRLKYLKWQDDRSETKILTNSDSLAKVDLAYVFNFVDGAADLPKRNMVRNFFTSISRVTDMTISSNTAEGSDLDPSEEEDPLEEEEDPSEEQVQIRLSSVPQCLLSSLELVEMKHFNGEPDEMEVARARPREEARISKLPDALISQILSYLPSKEAVRTSSLSKRWKSLWLLIPVLDLASSQFPDYNAFVSFVDRLLAFCREEKSCLHKLKLVIQKDVNDPPCVTRWIDFVVRGKLEHLDVGCLVNRGGVACKPLRMRHTGTSENPSCIVE